MSVLHLPLDLEILSQIQEQVERHKEHLLLLLDHHGQLSLIFLQTLHSPFVVWMSRHLFKFFGFFLECAHSEHISLDLMIDDLHSGVSNLVGRQELMELSEVRVGLEYVEQVQGQVYGLLVVVSESTGHRSKQSLMVQHGLHIAMIVAEIEQAHGSLGFCLNFLIVKLLQITLYVHEIDAREINLGLVPLSQTSIG